MSVVSDVRLSTELKTSSSRFIHLLSHEMYTERGYTDSPLTIAVVIESIIAHLKVTLAVGIESYTCLFLFCFFLLFFEEAIFTIMCIY